LFLIAQTIDIPRFIQVFIVQGFFGLFFLFMAYKILRREAKGINLILSGFYLFTGVGVIINIIYVNIYIESVVWVLHFITYFLLCLSLIFLLLFVLVLSKSEQVINLKIQLLLILIFSILILILLFIPDGIKINETTNWKPDWSIPFLIYSYIVCSSVAIGPSIFYALKIFQKIEHKKLKKKWKYFMIGISAYYFLYYGTSLSNTLADPTFRLIWSVISLPTLITLYFIYYGVAKQL